MQKYFINQQKEEALKVEKWKALEREAQEKLESDAKGLEKLASKVNNLEKNIAELTQKITELGALPNKESYSKCSKMTTKQLFKDIEKANNHLKKYRFTNFDLK